MQFCLQSYTSHIVNHALLLVYLVLEILCGHKGCFLSRLNKLTTFQGEKNRVLPPSHTHTHIHTRNPSISEQRQTRIARLACTQVSKLPSPLESTQVTQRTPLSLDHPDRQSVALTGSLTRSWLPRGDSSQDPPCLEERGSGSEGLIHLRDSPSVLPPGRQGPADCGQRGTSEGQRGTDEGPLTSRLRGMEEVEQEDQQDARLRDCRCQTRHLGEDCPSLLSAPRFIPKA